ncbi:helix-turn-helix transcriptional regulator [Mesorhizobium sp. B2-3-3]|nr:helix-turn-helix transcriptional regulator [Mesorhizobium sp. B2-3-3]
MSTVLPLKVNTSLLESNCADSEASTEIAQLLFRAMNFVATDEAAAVDLIRKASTLLLTRGLSSSDSTQDRMVAGGLAPWQIKIVTTFITERIGLPIFLPELAQLAKLSTSHFSAAFKASLGTTPHSYIVSRRIQLAKDRMLHSDSPLCEVALDCGFTDQSHLSRTFRRVTGTTPNAWRRYTACPVSANETRPKTNLDRD